MKKTAKAIGRPSLYSDALAAEICRLMAEEGLSVRKICLREGMPNRMTVVHWLADARRAEFLSQYTQAREALGDFYAEETIEISDENAVTIKLDGEDVDLVLDAAAIARNRLRVDARKWYASKLAPKKYGDKMDVTVEQKVVNVIDLGGRG